MIQKWVRPIKNGVLAFSYKYRNHDIGGEHQNEKYLVHVSGDGTVFFADAFCEPGSPHPPYSGKPYDYYFNDDSRDPAKELTFVYKINFEKSSFYRIWSGLSRLNPNGDLFRGNHLYLKWRPYNYRKIFLHKNVKNISDETEKHIENWLPDYSNQIYDVRYNTSHTWTWRFRIYFEDRKYLEKEIENYEKSFETAEL